MAALHSRGYTACAVQGLAGSAGGADGRLACVWGRNLSLMGRKFSAALFHNEDTAR
jgi:hypothetical protein